MSEEEKSKGLNVGHLQNFMRLMSLRAARRKALVDAISNPDKNRGVGVTRKAHPSDKEKRKKRKIAYQSKKINRHGKKKSPKGRKK